MTDQKQLEIYCYWLLYSALFINVFSNTITNLNNIISFNIAYENMTQDFKINFKLKNHK